MKIYTIFTQSRIQRETSFITWISINHFCMSLWKEGFPGGSDGKASACNLGDLSSITQLGRSPGEGHGYWLQYSCVENSMDRGDWRATVHGMAKSRTFTFSFGRRGTVFLSELAPLEGISSAPALRCCVGDSEDQRPCSPQLGVARDQSWTPLGSWVLRHQT